MGMIDRFDQDQMSEKQTQQLEEYVYNGYRLIYDPGEAVLKVATSNPNAAVEGIAKAAVLVAKKLDSSREAKGEPPFRDEIKIVGGKHLVDKICEFTEAATKKPLSAAEKQAALQQAYQSYMEDGIQNRTIDPAQLAVQAEKAAPGSVTQKLAALPDNIQPSGAQPPPAAPPPPEAQNPEQQAPEKPQGLLNQPSPLEKFL
jgi:hypothetical protein